MTDPRYPQPRWQVSLAGEDITGRIQPRLMQLTLTDNRGLEADQLDLTLDDSDGQIDLPSRGALIRLALGWNHTGLVDKGSYMVDEVEHSGAPDQITIRARSADLREGISTKKERSWHQKTVGEIVTTIASEAGLAPAISSELAGELVAHIDQTSESNANILTRLAEMFDAVATVKSGRLLFFKIGRGATISGTTLQEVTITRRDGDRHRFNVADREACDAVKACYHDLRAGKKGEVTITKDDASENDKGKANDRARLTHSASNVKTLRHNYSNKLNATRAARSALEKSKRGVSTFHISLAYGQPELMPELPATVVGFKNAIDGPDWLITRVIHRLAGSGYTTDVELELRLDKGEKESQEEA